MDCNDKIPDLEVVNGRPTKGAKDHTTRHDLLRPRLTKKQKKEELANWDEEMTRWQEARRRCGLSEEFGR